MRRGVQTVATALRQAALIVAAAATLCGTPATAALPPGERLVPASSKLFVTLRNVKELETAVRTTQLGKLIDDPLVAPFRADVQSQLDARFASRDLPVGIRLEDVRAVCDGQATFAIVPLAVAEGAAARTSQVLVLDVTGHEPQVTQLQQKIAAELAQRNARPQPLQTPGGAVGTLYVVPPQKEGDIQREFVEVVQKVGGDSVWMISDGASLPTFVSGVLAGGADPALAGNAAFTKLMADTTPPQGQAPANIAIFIEPLGFSAAMRAYEHPPQRYKPDGLEILRKVGFDAVQGVGGQVNVAVGDYGVLVRLGILAPKPWRDSMNMLTFIPGADFAPQAWIGNDAAAYAVLYWHVLTAFDHFGPIFDGFLEDPGIWPDVLDSFKNDPEGPQVDLRDSFFALAKNRVCGIVDRTLGAPGQAGQYLVAFEVHNSDKVAATLKKAFENDPTVTKSKLGELDIYELTATEQVAANAPDQKGVVNGQRTIVSALVTATNGYFYIASNLPILEKALGPAPEQPLATAPDYVAVATELQKFLPPADPRLVGLGFARADQILRDDYEMFRAGKLRGSDSMLGRLLLLAEEEDGEPQPAKKVDGSKLPPFQQIEHYFAPIGLMIRQAPDGFSIIGLTHEKAPPGPAAPQKPVGAAAESGTPTP